ncbi:hypothetical protein GALMADRAFT_256727 [Galerina marginata CBS 339.88]|uniref:F-box domain-containing protein n=1 Tax=Galerina marginata (strain CBS 339.88) TaxID=685588 RepID=A0A067SLE4_GALM3|nr:hypothetical protein GALMADRAFT_256727 [Galerina marginata CBS 339.88]
MESRVDTRGWRTDDSVPISALHQDLLWRIFLINADMDNDKPTRHILFSGDQKLDLNVTFPDWKNRALVTTWSCSHVCRGWRELIIHSPSLWGQLIDLEILVFVQPRWRDAIMNRTGKSNLIVKGNVDGRKTNTQDFLVSILRDHWVRIQSLKVIINKAHAFPSQTWDYLCRPAPVLRIFHFQPVDIPLSVTIGPLFANNAPQLTDFQSHTIRLKLAASTPWLSHIRRFELSCPESMPVQNWLRVLESMPQIESLDLAWALDIPLDTETSIQLHLPNLQDIRLFDRLRPCVVFLAQITPAVGCRLSFLSEFSTLHLPQPQDMILAGQCLSKYMQNWFGNRAVTALSVSITHMIITIQEYQNPSFRSRPNFCISIGSVEPEILPTVFPIFDAFSSSAFSKITTFEFNVLLPRLQVLGSSVARFLLSLQFVETLQTVDGSLHHLNYLEETLRLTEDEPSELLPSFFPRLRSVKMLRRTDRISDLSQLEVEDILSFINLRRNQAPVQVLDLADWRPLKATHVLNRISGLKVIFKTVGA